MKIAGYQGEGLFDSAAVRLLYQASAGTPRLINLMAHKALLVAYGKGLNRIDKRIMQAVVADTQGLDSGTRSATANYAYEIGAVVLLAAVTLLVLRLLQ